VGGKGNQRIPLGHWELARREMTSRTGPKGSSRGDEAGVKLWGKAVSVSAAKHSAFALNR